MELRNLTEREMNVLKLLTQGLENSEIASILSSKNRTQAIYVAMKNGMLM